MPRCSRWLVAAAALRAIAAGPAEAPAAPAEPEILGQEEVARDPGELAAATVCVASK